MNCVRIYINYSCKLVFVAIISIHIEIKNMRLWEAVFSVAILISGYEVCYLQKKIRLFFNDLICNMTGDQNDLRRKI